MVAVIIPPTVGVAMGFMISEPAPVLIKMGISARIVVAVVITIGRTRIKAALTTSSVTSRPFLAYFTKKSTMTTPSSTATPIAIAIPPNDMIFEGIFR